MKYKLDEGSFFLGMIEAFSELVMQEVKDLAFGPPMAPEVWSLLKEPALEIFSKFGVNYYEEYSLVHTDLAPKEALEGKLVPIIYLKDEVFESYLVLKHQVEDLEARGAYDSGEKMEASISLRRLLSYSEEAIRAAKPASFDY